MSDLTTLTRYSCITEKNPREIILLRGSGCKWRRCKFCDYHLDFNVDQNENFKFNADILRLVSGKYKRLEVINSGSFSDLGKDTMQMIKDTCVSKEISTLYFECHWNDRQYIAPLKSEFIKLGIDVQIKGGVETFDYEFRETVFCKGINTDSVEEIAKYYDQVCLLFGISGQTELSMKSDIDIALKYFNRICVNIMSENTTDVKPDPKVIRIFHERIYPIYKDNIRIDILFSNTDFGVGEMEAIK